MIGSQRAQRPERLLELRRLLVHEGRDGHRTGTAGKPPYALAATSFSRASGGQRTCPLWKRPTGRGRRMVAA